MVLTRALGLSLLCAGGLAAPVCGCGDPGGVPDPGPATPTLASDGTRAAASPGSRSGDAAAPARVPPAPMRAPVGPTAGERETILGPFLAAHWQLPVPLQGEPPPDFSEADRSLDPAACGACHPKQLAEWQGSLHAGAFSPGFAGQLIEGELAGPAEVRQCQTCHAPLGEQQPFSASLQAEPHFDASLRAQGIVCAACHVRAHRRYGPPRRPDAAAAPEPRPHGGFEARSEFQESRFCATCHQFFDDSGVNGKPVENTYVEWQASPAAAADRSCQSCHMPDRAHLWRGIHDPEMVRAAVETELVAFDLSGDRLEAALVLASRDVGHAFPTYVTPRVRLAVWQADAAGRELDATRVSAVIGRELDFSAQPWREVFDTRVKPGESVRLDYALERRPEAASLVGRVTVDPDAHYRGVFAALLPALSDPEARRLIAEAERRASESRYVLSEARLPLRNAAPAAGAPSRSSGRPATASRPAPSKAERRAPDRAQRPLQ